jgi:uncharacterized membrane protein (UPF0136 family)
MIATLTILYGVAMAAGGVAAWRRVGSLPSLVGGLAIGALAVAGGAMMLAGSEAGRGVAVLGSIFATLFFGWTLSVALREEERPQARPAILFATGLVVSAMLLLSR